VNATRGHRLVVVLATAVAAAATLSLDFGRGASSSPTGTLELRATLAAKSRPGALCPPGTPGEQIECHSRTGAGVIPGLGRVSHSYIYIAELSRPAGCTHVADVRVLATTVRVSVRGKGDLEVSLEDVPECMHPTTKLAPVWRAFTVTGGTGIYTGASGAGRLKHTLHQVPSGGARGTDTWSGTLVVPDLEFDVTAPRISEASAIVVRVARGTKSVRVRFALTAEDDVDGSLSVSCSPPSGSRFRLGTSRVSCSATDTSGNTRTARFTVTVRARR